MKALGNRTLLQDPNLHSEVTSILTPHSPQRTAAGRGNDDVAAAARGRDSVPEAVAVKRRAAPYDLEEEWQWPERVGNGDKSVRLC